MRPHASSPPSSAPPVVRTLPVPRGRVESAPTTAQLIHRTDATVARPLYASLGVALHHFTEILGDAVDPLEMHRATTVLTKQVLALLDQDDALDAIHRLVIDPARSAMPDGRRAVEFCGDRWSKVCAVATQRSIASCEGADEFGLDAILNLAVVRSVGATEPWWGTPMWVQRVELLPADAIDASARSLLLNEPELADDDILAMVLDDRRQRRTLAAVDAENTRTRGRSQGAAVTNERAEVPALGSVMC